MTSLDTTGQDIKNVLMVNYVNLVHVLLVGPLLVYTSTRCNKGDKILKLVLLLLGLLVMAMHVYLMVERANKYGN